MPIWILCFNFETLLNNVKPPKVAAVLSNPEGVEW